MPLRSPLLLHVNAPVCVYILSVPLELLSELNPSNLHELVIEVSVCEGKEVKRDGEAGLWVVV